MTRIKVQIIMDNTVEPEEAVMASGSTIGQLKKGLNPKMEYLFIINGTNKLDSYILQDGDVVKVVPVMSGG